MLYPWGMLLSNGVLYRERSCPSLVFEGREGAGFCQDVWVLNMDPTLWVDGARPANTCIPPSFLGEHACAAAWRTHPQKYIKNSTENCRIMYQK
jgi:hypothetical protein